MSLAEISYGNANGFLTSHLYPGNVAVFTIPNYYSSGLTQDRWAALLLPIKRFSPDICGLILEHELEMPPCLLSEVSLWAALGPRIPCFGYPADATKGPSAEMLPLSHSRGERSTQLRSIKLEETLQWGRGHPARPTDRQAGQKGLSAKLLSQDLQSCFPLQWH